MRADTAYTPSTVFETYPFPAPGEALERPARSLENTRSSIMLKRGLGLTDLYNKINNPSITGMRDSDVARLRTIHCLLDQAVLDSYGWDDITLNHGFHEFRNVVRWSISPAARREILDRLVEECHRRDYARRLSQKHTHCE